MCASVLTSSNIVSVLIITPFTSLRFLSLVPFATLVHSSRSLFRSLLINLSCVADMGGGKSGGKGKGGKPNHKKKGNVKKGGCDNPQTIRLGDWSCGLCHSHNYSGRETCFRRTCSGTRAEGCDMYAGKPAPNPQWMQKKADEKASKAEKVKEAKAKKAAAKAKSKAMSTPAKSGLIGGPGYTGGDQDRPRLSLKLSPGTTMTLDNVGDGDYSASYGASSPLHNEVLMSTPVAAHHFAPETDAINAHALNVAFAALSDQRRHVLGLEARMLELRQMRQHVDDELAALIPAVGVAKEEEEILKTRSRRVERALEAKLRPKPKRARLDNPGDVDFLDDQHMADVAAEEGQLRLDAQLAAFEEAEGLSGEVDDDDDGDVAEGYVREVPY